MEYNYSRELVNGAYNIDNPLRVDLEGNQIYLAKEIQAQIPSIIGLKCHNSNCEIDFSEELTTEEKALLDTLVSNHKNNT
jgi:hypothetical protein